MESHLRGSVMSVRTMEKASTVRPERIFVRWTGGRQTERLHSAYSMATSKRMNDDGEDVRPSHSSEDCRRVYELTMNNTLSRRLLPSCSICSANNLLSRRSEVVFLVQKRRLNAAAVSSHYEVAEGRRTRKGKVVALLGIPNDDNSSYLKGCAKAPPLIRHAFHSASSNYWSESGIDLGSLEASVDGDGVENDEVAKGWTDLGDLNFDDNSQALTPFEVIDAAVESSLVKGRRILSLGGDHSITYPLVKAYSRHFSSLNILHIDAHPDLYDSLDSNYHSHASPFARIMENNHACRLVQVGIRTMNGHQQEQANRFGVEVMTMKDFDPSIVDTLDDGPLYVSLDLDGLDPAYCPGVSHHEPGGLTTRQVLDIIQRIRAPIVGADIVEYNPSRDINGMTAAVAAKMVKELLAKMIEL